MKSKAFWVGKDVMAWPAAGVPAGANLALLNWRLHWSPTGGLGVDAESVTGGSVADLTYDPAGLPAAVLSAHPELKGYLALRLNSKTARQAGSILQGQVAVALYDDLGRLLDATGVQTPGVLDDLWFGRCAYLRGDLEEPVASVHGAVVQRAFIHAVGTHRPEGIGAVVACFGER
jgi:hypothetical protein